jgi:plastocyanin
MIYAGLKGVQSKLAQQNIIAVALTALLRLNVSAVAANVPVQLSEQGPDPQIIAINVGDTLTWQMRSGFTNLVASLDGEWSSPLFTNTTATFSHTFKNAGFFVYRTGSVAGTITVLSKTNGPPIVSLIAPIDGFVFRSTWSIPLVAVVDTSATNVLGVIDVGFVVDGTVIAFTNAPPAWSNAPPYRFQWQIWAQAPGAVGRHTLSAIAHVKESVPFGEADKYEISRPVNVYFGEGGSLFSAQFLPTGQFMFYYDTELSGGLIAYADKPVSGYYFSGPPPGVILIPVQGFGVYVDFANANAPRRFYSLNPMPAP